MTLEDMMGALSSSAETEEAIYECTIDEDRGRRSCSIL